MTDPTADLDAIAPASAPANRSRPGSCSPRAASASRRWWGCLDRRLQGRQLRDLPHR